MPKAQCYWTKRHLGATTDGRTISTRLLIDSMVLKKKDSELLILLCRSNKLQLGTMHWTFMWILPNVNFTEDTFSVIALHWITEDTLLCFCNSQMRDKNQKGEEGG